MPHASVVKLGDNGNIIKETAFGGRNCIPANQGAWFNYLEYCLHECTNEVCYDYQCETAFGGSSAGPTTSGNRAWWFYYNTSTGGEQIIWAGKTINAGTVKYENGYIVISLAEGWDLKRYYFVKDDLGKEICGEFTDVPYTEAVKIQGYNALPTSKPAPGLFTTYKGMELTVSVDSCKYFVIHLDLVKRTEITCP